MDFSNSELFKLYDKQNKTHNTKLTKKSDFNEIINNILNSKFENLRDRCKINDENAPLLKTIENSFEEVVEREMKCCYCGITMVYFVDAKNSHEQERDEKYRFIASIEHKTPLSKGGNNTKQNIDFCCLTCNIVKDNLLVEDYVKLIEKLDYNDLMNLYETKVTLNRFVNERIRYTRELKKENDNHHKNISSKSKELSELKKKFEGELKKKENTIEQLKSNVGSIKRENINMRKELENSDCGVEMDTTVDELKDNLIRQLKEQNRMLKNLNQNENRIKYIEIGLERAKNGNNKS